MDEAWCYQTFRRCRWPDGAICVRCGSRKVTVHTRLGHTPRLRYLCFGCRRTFTDLTGTIFARSNLPLTKWFLCLGLLGHGRNTAELARVLRVKWDTAARLQRHLALGLIRPGLLRQLRDATQEAI